ncbi:MAG: hypothetical protein LAN84_08445 [Acidobacteriia bacterium]|nr:hypothetical protein [Terriglobia bacterium]
MYLYEVNGAQRPAATPALAGALGEAGSLKHFAPSELTLSPEETLAVYRFFWPDLNFSGLGALTDKDREFAQALLVEAIDASCTMGVVEDIYNRFFMKIPGSFKDIAKSAMKIAARAIAARWFGRCRLTDPGQARIYESIRRTLALKFKTVIVLRLSTGELDY